MNKTVKRILNLILFSLLLTQIGFSQSIEQFVTDTIKVDKENVPIDPSQYYFPKIMFPSYGLDFTYEGTKAILIEGEYDEFSLEWYSEHLFEMKEPLLFNRKTEKEIFRFTWLRTFDKPIAIRIEKSKKDYWLYWKKLNGKGGYEPGILITNRKKRISEREWLNFKKLIKKTDFWNMDYAKGIFGNDGSQWILEGANSTDYRVVDRWSPRNGDFYNACDYLISLTNLNIKEKNKY
jgi:hypothetical protein